MEEDATYCDECCIATLGSKRARRWWVELKTRKWTGFHLTRSLARYSECRRLSVRQSFSSG